MGNPLVERLGWTLVHFVWEGAAIAALLALALWLTKRDSARTRYALACAALAVLAVAPVLTFRALVADAPGFTFSMAAGSMSQARDEAFLYAARPFDGLLPHLVSAWIAGVVLLSARLVGTLLHLERWRRRHTRPAGDEWQARVDTLARSLGIRRPIRVLVSDRVGSPSAWGVVKAVVVLPASLLTHLPPVQIETILLHELAHIRRHDYLVNLLQAVVETVLFYHPAVWWVSAVVRREREHCCDDLVVDRLADPMPYARALLHLEERRLTLPRPTLSAKEGNLMNRIARILTPKPTPPRVSPLASTMAALGILGALLGGTLQAQAQAQSKKPLPPKLVQKKPLKPLSVKLKPVGARLVPVRKLKPVAKLTPVPRLVPSKAAPATVKIDWATGRIKNGAPRRALHPGTVVSLVGVPSPVRLNPVDSVPAYVWSSGQGYKPAALQPTQSIAVKPFQAPRATQYRKALGLSELPALGSLFRYRTATPVQAPLATTKLSLAAGALSVTPAQIQASPPADLGIAGQGKAFLGGRGGIGVGNSGGGGLGGQNGGATHGPGVGIGGVGGGVSIGQGFGGTARAGGLGFSGQARSGGGLGHVYQPQAGGGYGAVSDLWRNYTAYNLTNWGTDATVEVDKATGLLSLDTKGDVLASVLRALAKRTKSSIVIKEGKYAGVTLVLSGVSIEKAIDIVCRTADATWRKEGNVYYVTPKGK